MQIGWSPCLMPSVIPEDVLVSISPPAVMTVVTDVAPIAFRRFDRCLASVRSMPLQVIAMIILAGGLGILVQAGSVKERAFLSKSGDVATTGSIANPVLRATLP